ncbi:MAG: PIN domain-containing protein [Pirellulales bacterium]|nr:PIN domain-containing protein [Pirellulales bacterium]
MKGLVILDTGPLVAHLFRNDIFHAWSAEQWTNIERPLLTCEPVLAEACYLVRAIPNGSNTILDFVRRGVVRIAFHLEDHLEPISQSLKKYANVPMSLADACLVRMAETIPGSSVLTLDRDFRIYRKSNRTVVPTIAPE